MAGKTIIFCADGTWNGLPSSNDSPQAHSAVAADTTSELGEGLAGCSNVYRLFDCLRGDIQAAVSDKKEQEKIFSPQNSPLQVAKYIHGVGDSSNVVQKFAEGAFGIGVVARIARGYTYISRNYNKGDTIVIVGFSRGAYTARALAGLITTMGLLKPDLASDPDNKYSNAFATWNMYRERKHRGLIQELTDFFTTVAEKRLISDVVRISDDSFVGNSIKVQAVAVWDTVGAMGIPFMNWQIPGTTFDLFQFTDTRLSESVLYGFHAMSIDEKRPPFTPTFWDDRNNITQRLFAGAHSDVGGGYDNHGLANITLQWMIKNLQAATAIQFDADCVAKYAPDALDTAHRPWAKLGYQILNPRDRKYPQGHRMEVDTSVRTRSEAPGVPPDLDLPPEPYQPTNIKGIPYADDVIAANAVEDAQLTNASVGIPAPSTTATPKKTAHAPRRGPYK